MASAPADQWASGNAYEAYMGRWSRELGRAFIEWLAPMPGGHWLEVGCGTGALTGTIAELAAPTSLVACDPAEPFVAFARNHLDDARVSFAVANAASLPARLDGFDMIVSGLVLNFVPEPEPALRGMVERLASNGTVAAYVWDYAAGLEFLRHFWDEAVARDPAAAQLDEGTRFPLCNPSALGALFISAGLAGVETRPLEIATEFRDFDDYWRPFLGGTGPAPTYVASLDEVARAALRDALERRLAPAGGALCLRARAWAVRGRARRDGRVA
ncbi:MAG TPA: methyltransferase domain-containing protein [Polyangiaceae bacterium]